MPAARNVGIASARNMGSSAERSVNVQPLDKSNGRMHKRSRSGMNFHNNNRLHLIRYIVCNIDTNNFEGCFTCRLRRKKCDEGHPACKACTNLNVKCEYKRPVWWGTPEQRRQQKERIKTKIKQTKSLERSGSLQGTSAVVKLFRHGPDTFANYNFNRSYEPSSLIGKSWRA